MHSAGHERIGVYRARLAGRCCGSIRVSSRRQRQIAVHIAASYPLRRRTRGERRRQIRAEIEGQEGSAGKAPKNKKRCQKPTTDQKITAMTTSPPAAHPYNHATRVVHTCSYAQ